MATRSSKKGPKIFLSYRREDSGGDAGRLRDSLEERLGPEATFYDLEGIDPGEDFPARLSEALEACDIVLAIIGPRWESMKSSSGTSLFDRKDWVRRELAAGLKSKRIRVVPVLVNRDRPPDAGSLPRSLRTLAKRNAYPIRRERWSIDVDELLRQLGIPRRHTADGTIASLRKQAGLVSLSIEWKRTERPDPTPRRWVVYIRNASDGPVYVENVIVKSPELTFTIDWGTVEPGAVSDYELDETEFGPSGDPPDVSMVFRDGHEQRWRLSQGRLRLLRP